MNQKTARARRSAARKGEGGGNKIEFRRTHSSILFLDVKGYSGLSENGMKLFAEKLLPRMAEIAESHGYEYLNTWGDAIVIASEDIKAITNIALDLRSFLRDN